MLDSAAGVPADGVKCGLDEVRLANAGHIATIVFALASHYDASYINALHNPLVLIRFVAAVKRPGFDVS